MADEKEKVLYEFQGDVSSLKNATQQAIGMLDKFQSQMDKANSNGIVKASQRAQTGFQNSINKMFKNMDSLQKKMNSIGDVKMPRGSEAFNATKTAVDTLLSSLNKFSSSNTITSKSLNGFKADLNNVTTGLRAAKPAYDELIAKEQKFQNQLSMIETKASQFGSRVAGATQRVQSAFSTMGTFVNSKLNAMGAMFTPLVTKIQGMKDKASIAGNRIAQVFSTAASAFRRTAFGADSAKASHDKLGSTVNSVGEKVRKETKEIDKEKESLDKKEKALKNTTSAHDRFSSAITGITSAIAGENGILKGLIDSFFTLAGVDIGNMLADGAKSAIDFVENMNLFQVAMGSSIDKGTAFINKMQEIYGMDPSNLMRYSGYFYQLTDAIGMADGASASISLSLTKMANDLASLFNKDIETTVQALASGMQGMSRTVRQFGMDIRTSTLQVTALKYGLQGQVEEMSEANRQALRFITMHEQAQNAINQTTKDVNGGSVAMGDFARNIETPANQLRIFKEQMAQLGRAIGNFIVAPLAKVLPYINGFIMALRSLINFIGGLFGISVKAGNSLSDVGDSAGKAAAGVSGIGSSADKAKKKLKQLIAPFDELNVLQEQTDDSGSGGGAGGGFGSDVLDPKLAEAIAGMELSLENVRMKANEVRDSILEFLGFEVSTDPITGEQVIQWDKEAFQTNVMDSLDNFKNWFSDLTPLQQGAVAVGGLYGAFLLLSNPITAVLTALTLLTAYSEPFRTAMENLGNTFLTSLVPIGENLSSLFTTVGTDIVNMWSTHIEPTIASIGDALAPALDTLGSLWSNVATIIADVFSIVENLWTTVLKPIIEGAMEIIQDLAEKFETLWEDYVGPVFEYIGDGIERVWKEHLKPVIDKVIEIIGKLWELIMALWNTVLSPVIDWIAKVLGPIFVEVFKAIWDGVEWAIGLVMNIIGSLLDVLEGIIDFLVGVFTGDWKRAWMGLVNIFVGIGNFIIDIFEGVINGIIWLVNSLIEVIWQGIQGLINIVLGAVEGIADLLGFDLNLTLNASIPNIPEVSIPRIPKMATGGVVTGPTHLIAGEGKYSEAILPLEDSPQMQDLIDKIADAVDKDKPDGNGGTTEVHVYIGGKEYDAFTYKSSQRGKTVVGKQPVKIGG